ncbi:MAG TPA: energy transducer TonB [Candidatus Acidoferrum sp.]|nr:energy transducer TonB [Candidatus Acidoferrum sp.]
MNAGGLYREPLQRSHHISLGIQGTYKKIARTIIFLKFWCEKCRCKSGVNFAGHSGFKDMIVKEFKQVIVVWLLAALGAGSVGAFALLGQVAEIPESRRKVRVLAKPQYPDLARKLNLSGVVKIEVTIGSDGKVKRTHIIGGNPVLATEAGRAAMQSEFEPGPKETTEIIEFKFSPQ